MKKKLLLLILPFIIFYSCISNRTVNQVFVSEKCKENSQSISFTKARDSLQFLDGHFVEISGYFIWGSEEFAISENKKVADSKDVIWIDLSNEIIDSIFMSIKSDKKKSSFDKIQGKKIKIKGVVNSFEHGHLNQYMFSIKQVCYFEIL